MDLSCLLSSGTHEKEILLRILTRTKDGLFGQIKQTRNKNTS